MAIFSCISALVGKKKKSKSKVKAVKVEKSVEIEAAGVAESSLDSDADIVSNCGHGIKSHPQHSHFASLRSVNLSGNSIVYITPESFPKSIHTLNLSRNKIATVEGLKELTRLRVLDLRYNRIPRIGQGLSNCTLIKELYLSGNKIVHVGGVHGLLK
ncbi:hypothetical protein AAC387_Pa11g1306 [Persea americana]